MKRPRGIFFLRPVIADESLSPEAQGCPQKEKARQQQKNITKSVT